MQLRPGAPSEGGRDSRPKILIVDDDATFCAGIRRVLSESEDGFDVRCAADCFEAGFQLGTFRPDVVILDLVMPGLSGLAICDRIRRHATLRDVKIVVLTGFPGGGNRERAKTSPDAPHELL